MANSDKMRIYGIIVVVILVASMTVAYLLLHFKYKITEEEHQFIVDELSAGRKDPALMGTAKEAK